MGLMGTSIASCILASGHPVHGFDKDQKRRSLAAEEIRRQVEELLDSGLLRGRLPEILNRFHLVAGLNELSESRLIIECITEDLTLKKETLRAVEEAVSPTTIVGSNTSAIPLTTLQCGMRHPGRVLGIHWAEPAHLTRFLEIIKGEETQEEYVEFVTGLSRLWGKEPTVLQRDIRGFITNRVSYAMFREAIHLVESGVATMEDVDRSLRNDVGYWMTFAGPFRYMDLMGVAAYETVMRDLLPDLCSNSEVPRLIKEVVDSGGNGVSNGRGFYRYSSEESRRWIRRFREFNLEIHRLALKYPEPPAEQKQSEEE